MEKLFNFLRAFGDEDLLLKFNLFQLKLQQFEKLGKKIIFTVITFILQIVYLKLSALFKIR